MAEKTVKKEEKNAQSLPTTGEGFLLTPFNEFAEQSVIGAAIQSKFAVEQCLQRGLKPEDFYIAKNAEIFRAIVQLFSLDVAIDFVTLSEQLKRQNALETVGGLQYLGEVTALVATTANLPYHLDVLIDLSMRRQVMQAANGIITEAKNAENPTEQLLDFAEQQIFEIVEGRENVDFTKAYDIIKLTHSELEKILAGEHLEQGVATGFTYLDAKLSGLQKGNLVLIAARPGMGKTSLALNIGLNVARATNLPIAFFSLEMSNKELCARLWSSDSYVPLEQIQNADLPQRDWQQLVESMEGLADVPFFIDDGGGTTVSQMRAKCRRLIREKGGLSLVIIDHIQLMSSGKRVDNRQQEVAEISRSLKLLAKDLEVPVIVLSQLNRNPEARKTARPALSDLRESGAIEQDADVVLMIYREDYYDQSTENANIAEISIAKHRNGPTGVVQLSWTPEITTFRTMEQRDLAGAERYAEPLTAPMPFANSAYSAPKAGANIPPPINNEASQNEPIILPDEGNYVDADLEVPF